MLSSLITAIRTLTVLPVPGKESPNRASSLPWFPIVGLVLGLAVYGITSAGYGYCKWPEGMSVMAVVSGIILTRCLHMDGLADWADGFWGGMDKQATLRIMKDSFIGSFGVCALICAVLTKWVCFTRLLNTNSAWWIVPAYVVSRTSQSVMSGIFSYARDEGGTARTYVQGAGAAHAFVSILLAAVCIWIMPDIPESWKFRVFFILPAGLGPAFLIGLWSNRRLGGITGDVIGAASEITEITVLILGAVVSS